MIRMIRMIRIVLLFITALTTAMPSFAASTGKGKIIYTMGHTGPSCRAVLHRANNTGVETYFRIADIPGDDDVQTIILSALMAKKDVDIFYDPAQTSGCGTEPRISYVILYSE